MERASPFDDILKAWQSAWAVKLVEDVGALHVLQPIGCRLDEEDHRTASATAPGLLLHPKFRRRQEALEGSTEATFCISNYELLSASYGAEAARLAYAQVLAAVQAAIANNGVAAPAGAGVIDVFLTNAAAVCGRDEPQAVRKWFLRFSRDLTLVPIQTRSGPLHVRLEVSPIKGPQDLHASNLVAKWDQDAPAKFQVFRSDMARVSAILHALQDAGKETSTGGALDVEVLWSPIVPTCAQDGADIFEASLGAIAGDGTISNIDDALLSADRLGLVHVIDHFLLVKAVEELAIHSSSVVVLAAVSVNSFCNTDIWEDLFCTLAARPDVAKRLIIELHHRGTHVEWSKVSNVISQLKNCGTKFAIGNFASGEVSIKQLMSLRAEFITVEVRPFTTSGQKEVFSHLLDLARALGAEPIVGGIENEISSKFATSLGAKFQKGQWLGPARVCRPWATGCSHWKFEK